MWLNGWPLARINESEISPISDVKLAILHDEELKKFFEPHIGPELANPAWL